MTVYPRTFHAHVPWPGGDGQPEEPYKDTVPRQTARYECAKGHVFELTFAADAEVPAAWDCRCGRPARREGAPEGTGDSTRLPPHTPHRKAGATTGPGTT